LSEGRTLQRRAAPVGSTPAYGGLQLGGEINYRCNGVGSRPIPFSGQVREPCPTASPMHGRAAEPSETPARLIGLMAAFGQPPIPRSPPAGAEAGKTPPPRGVLFFGGTLVIDSMR
jgi:hypothetical protein